jgi:polyisoprenoid-binding protein YceI
MSLHDRTTPTGKKTATPRPTAPSDSLEQWTIDPTRSRLKFSLRHLVIQQIRGEFTRWGGELFLDRVEPWLSSVHVWVDLASISTDAPERDDHVRSPEFLDVARFPRADFKSSNVEVRDERVAMRGRLDLHGIVGDIELEIEPGATTHEPSGTLRSRYGARGTLDRQAFGLHWNQDLDAGGIVVGDRIEIVAELELVRASEDDEPEPV